jgi:hypothetical protein
MLRSTPVHIFKVMVITLALFCIPTTTQSFILHSHNNIRQSLALFSNNIRFFSDIPPTTKAFAAASLLALILANKEPAVALTGVPTSPTAAQIHINKLPPSTISVDIDDLPFIGGILSGTYRKIDDTAISPAVSTKTSSPHLPPVIIKSPDDKATAIKNAATGGHLEFDVDGILQTHINVDVASSKGVAAVRVESPLIPKLPFRNAASALIPPGVSALKLAHSTSAKQNQDTQQQQQQHPTAAHISLNSLPPSAISVDIQDLPVLGKALSGVYTKVTDDVEEVPSAVTIESPKDKVSAIKAIASSGHLEFDIDGIISTHLDVDVATDTVGAATIRVASPLIPALPFQNAASF